jgi:hypothetical protein
VFKLIGPVLVKQEQADAKSTVEKRLDFIKGEMCMADFPYKSPTTHTDSIILPENALKHCSRTYPRSQRGKRQRRVHVLGWLMVLLIISWRFNIDCSDTGCRAGPTATAGASGEGMNAPHVFLISFFSSMPLLCVLLFEGEPVNLNIVSLWFEGDRKLQKRREI